MCSIRLKNITPFLLFPFFCKKASAEIKKVTISNHNNEKHATLRLHMFSAV